MARIEEKIAEIADPALRQSIGEEVAKLKKNTRFGLVFEEHQPEVVPIYGKRVKRGERVALKIGALSEIWRVVSVKDSIALCELEKSTKAAAGTRESFSAQELVVIRSMGEPIYPSLTPIDSVTNGDPTAPHHVLIEADNYHALQLLMFPYESKVDCIYIDPPYNSGARDWKYNNDYVDKNDQWQHSKWLAFMVRRLRLAKRLLKPEASALLVTIDEKEYLRLGMLLEQEFPEARIQMVSTMINPANVARAGGFGRSDEYVFVVLLGEAAPGRIRLSREWVSSKGRTHTGNVRWDLLRRSGGGASRSDSPGCFYPIYIDPYYGTVAHVGAPLPEGTSEPIAIDGLIPVLPLRKSGIEGRWQWTPETFKDRMAQGRVRIGGNPTRGFVIYILKDGEYGKIQRGEFQELGRAADGSIIVEDNDASYVLAVPGSQWRIASHDATQYGSRLLGDILPSHTFPFPKSLYAVRDVLRFFIEDNSTALTVDFFAGSATTLNAVNLINATDGGQRQCILVTNNEVSDEESRTLTAQGFQPGQDEWEQHGICRSVSWPRSKFTMLGKRDDGTPLPGDYLTGKQVTREKPRTVRQLGFAEGRNLPLAQRKQVAALLPGVTQSKIDDGPWFLDDDVAVSVLWDERQAPAWLEALSEADHVNDLCVATTESRLFAALKAQIIETLGPQEIVEDEKRPLAAGFSANLEYFRLDFLDPQEVQMGRQFAAILPILWMMAGARGARPQAPDPHAPWLLPNGCPFVVLMQETRFKEFVRHVESRADLTHVFIVTNSQNTVYKLRHEWPELRVVQLYKDYLENFRINLSEKSAQ
ncbi:MAG: site-specific DNA-methyltransferase [Rhodoferax sp.]|nr:site-specific DNA-methyltransferase [Rhodoferax sp.]